MLLLFLVIFVNVVSGIYTRPPAPIDLFMKKTLPFKPKKYAYMIEGIALVVKKKLFEKTIKDAKKAAFK